MPDNKDTIVNEPMEKDAKENKPVMNVISENDGERLATTEYLRSENHIEKDQKLTSINSIKSVNNSENLRINLNNNVQQVKKNELLSPSIKKSTKNSGEIKNEISSPTQSSIKKVSNNSTIYKNQELKESKLNEKSISPEIKQKSNSN